jgi:hypothetical protein
VGERCAAVGLRLVRIRDAGRMGPNEVVEPVPARGRFGEEMTVDEAVEQPAGLPGGGGGKRGRGVGVDVGSGVEAK